jgi:hypothetical protein
MGLAQPEAVFLHCLPRKPEEVSDEVFDFVFNIIFLKLMDCDFPSSTYVCIYVCMYVCSFVCFKFACSLQTIECMYLCMFLILYCNVFCV